jgi:hypothetical protein
MWLCGVCDCNGYGENGEVGIDMGRLKIGGGLKMEMGKLIF